MDTFEGYNKADSQIPIVGKRYYYFSEFFEEGQKVILTNPKIGKFLKKYNYQRGYKKIVFLVDEKEVDVYYGCDAGNLYLKEYININENIFCLIS